MQKITNNFFFFLFFFFLFRFTSVPINCLCSITSRFRFNFDVSFILNSRCCAYYKNPNSVDRECIFQHRTYYYDQRHLFTQPQMDFRLPNFIFFLSSTRRSATNAAACIIDRRVEQLENYTCQKTSTSNNILQPRRKEA